MSHYWKILTAWRTGWQFFNWNIHLHDLSNANEKLKSSLGYWEVIYLSFSCQSHTIKTSNFKNSFGRCYLLLLSVSLKALILTIYYPETIPSLLLFIFTPTESKFSITDQQGDKNISFSVHSVIQDITLKGKLWGWVGQKRIIVSRSLLLIWT